MSFENNNIGEIKRQTQENSKEELKNQIEKLLVLPGRVREGNSDKGLVQKLGSFLVEQNFIDKIDMWRGSWGCKYEDKKVYINEFPMPEEQYKYYIFRLGKNSFNGKQLFPAMGSEADQYRFVHEAGHAYQEYIAHKEFPSDPEHWYDNAVKEKIKSNSGILFNHCYLMRKENSAVGLSTWGNVPDYNDIEDPDSQNAIRAIEDMNELITMYLWNPEYLDTYLDYLACEIPNYGEENLRQDRLRKISEREKRILKISVKQIIDEMKDDLDF